jgi:hypothetical protein
VNATKGTLLVREAVGKKSIHEENQSVLPAQTDFLHGYFSWLGIKIVKPIPGHVTDFIKHSL